MQGKIVSKKKRKKIIALWKCEINIKKCIKPLPLFLGGLKNLFAVKNLLILKGLN